MWVTRRWCMSTDFNPRTPVGCDNRCPRATSVQTLFQSTHPSGVRLTRLLALANEASFQSTHPSGVRPDSDHKGARFRNISIHAPQWGATRVRPGRPCPPAYFNPRTPVGCDGTQALRHTQHLKFQSTHPSGVRRTSSRLCHTPSRFQSTHPSGVRRGGCRALLFHFIFQSTHPSGVRRLISVAAVCRALNFNPRTPVGCDCCHSVLDVLWD